MLTVIFIDEASKQDWTAQALETLRQINSVGEIVVVSDRAPDLGQSNIRWASSASSMMEGLREAINISAAKRIVILSSVLLPDQAGWSAFISEADSTSLSNHLVATLASDGELLEHPTNPGDSIVATIAKNDEWPLMAIATTRTAITHAFSTKSESISEAICAALIIAAADGDGVSQASSTLPTRADSMASAINSLDNATRARLLKLVVDNHNIEDLFPNLSWQEFSQESAAAAYHAISALFIRFGDIDSANQCLSCSEPLEESPRYFALKGLIQREKGETLGAVANLVSSLQCYESRKKNDGNHYLTFMPTDLEAINSKLVDGLEALNKRDNARALENFREAVFQFDPFYKNYGVTRK